MNIVELRDRLTDIINQNNERFPDENRNQYPVFFKNQVSKRIVEYKSIDCADSSLYSFIDSKNGFVVANGRFSDNSGIKIIYGKNRKLGK